MSSADNGPSGLPAEPPAARPPSLVPTSTLLILAAVLIVVVLVKPTMPGWLRTTIAVLAVLVVVALLILSVRLFRSATRRGGRP